MKQKGFTLVELLAVIAIIGVIAAVILVNLTSARSKSRDARRLADIYQFQKALELYYDDNKQYPPSTGATAPNSSWSNSNDSSWATLQTELVPYLSLLPIDPSQSSSGWAGAGQFSYAYFSTGYGCNRQWFMIVILLERASGPDPGVKACDGTVFQYGGAGANTAIKTFGHAQ